MQAELESRSQELEGVIKSIYFGGGTPSVLAPDELKQLLDTASALATISEDAEITLEANPDDLSLDQLDAWKTLGINRLSMGIQSFHEEDLKWMNRAHSAKEALSAIDMARQAGFERFTIDLIYGLPYWKEDEWRRNLDALQTLDVDHFSCYLLTVEEGTALGHRVAKQKESLATEELVERNYAELCDFASAAGYDHYELSNFTKPGKQAVHNTSYWRGESYLGIGPGAHSFDGSIRRWNVSSNPGYIRKMSLGEAFFEQETLSKQDRYNEYIMTGLRTARGISLGESQALFGLRPDLVDPKKWEERLRAGHLISSGDRYRVPEASWLLTDSIASDLFAL